MRFIKIKRQQTIYKYLEEFNDCFPHLKEKVDLFEFSKKLSEKAECYIVFFQKAAIGITFFYANDRDNGCGYITLIGVKKDQRSNGTGKKLLNFSIDKMIEKGMKKAKLEVDKDNLNAQGFYEHLGFKKCYEMPKSFYMEKEI